MTHKLLFLIVPLLTLASMAHGQDIPAVTVPSYQGFSLPSTEGTLTYGITGSESVRTGYYNSGQIWSSSLSGNLGYISTGSAHPFSAIYSGGYSYSSGSSGQFGSPSAFFQDLALSQVLKVQRWSFVVSDMLNYLPETASGGLSGIPGLGDIGVPSPTGTDTGQGILTNFGSHVSNIVSGTASRQITGSTALNGSGSYYTQSFVGSAPNGLNLNQWSAGAGLTHRLDALSSLNGNYSYSKSSYSANNFSFVSQGVTIGYNRQVNRQMSFGVSGGPERSTSSATGLPASISFSAGASFNYTGESSTTALTYSRGVQNGSGVVEGGLSDSVILSYTRRISRLVSTSVYGGWARNSSIEALTSSPFSTETFSGSVQANRGIGRRLSAYVSYTALNQSLSGSATASNGFSGLSQVIAAGISYSPKPIHIGHQ
jgi:hypothetical protein